MNDECDDGIQRMYLLLCRRCRFPLLAGEQKAESRFEGDRRGRVKGWTDASAGFRCEMDAMCKRKAAPVVVVVLGC